MKTTLSLPILIAPLLLVVPAVGFAEDDLRGAVEFFGGYARLDGAGPDAGNGGVIGVAPVIYFRGGNEGLRFGVRPEFSYQHVSFGASDQDTFNFIANLQVEWAKVHERIDVYAFAGLGGFFFNRTGGRDGGLALEAGGGARLFVREDLYFAPGVSFLQAFNDNDFFMIHVTGAVGAIF